jgi:hypothetical protein
MCCYNASASGGVLRFRQEAEGGKGGADLRVARPSRVSQVSQVLGGVTVDESE